MTESMAEPDSLVGPSAAELPAHRGGSPGSTEVGPGGPAADVPLPPDRDRGFEELYRREYDPMVRLAVLLVGRDGPAQEAVHDSFAKVYERWDKVENHGGYLRTTVVNRCRDVHRGRLRERKRAATSNESLESVSTELGALELVDALDKLPAKRRAALVLRFYADMSEAEIADALGVPAGTVKSLVSRGLAELRKVVER